MDTRRYKARVIAFYLPQFHPIPENDQWWGEGFTEWHNVRNARPLYPGHYQPHEPAELGYYDLRDAAIREAQAALARQYGIEGFCYWHYWFGNGQRLLERPFNEVLESGKPDFPFCLGWANESWTGIWYGAADRILVEQTYPGEDDYHRHFYALLPAFQDPRYLKIDDKPIFLIYRPEQIPDIVRFTSLWNSFAVTEGLPGIAFIAQPKDHPLEGLNYALFEAFTFEPFARILDLAEPGRRLRSLRHSLRTFDVAAFTDELKLIYRIVRLRLERTSRDSPQVLPYDKIIPLLLRSLPQDKNYVPFLIPNWDNTPRCGTRGVVYDHATPELFRIQLEYAVRALHHRPHQRRIIFVKSWNEWAEGNYVEPEKRYGRQYLEAIKAVVTDDQ
ncbi:MAG TPA: glycoside hydrolase family 99-like domain-containing protein [Oligoflexia bacterium]|nr:glycoside hydrolase family 99-like domain-containing protein [Oligoflexia bacterium]